MDLSWLYPNFLTQPMPNALFQQPANAAGVVPQPSGTTGPGLFGTTPGAMPAGIVRPGAPAVVPPSGAAFNPGLPMPALPRQVPTNSGQVNLGFNIPDLPAPPLIPQPPVRGGAAPIDFSQTNKWLDAGAPTTSGHLANILGGFAQGAAAQGNVTPTFSQMLAQIGAGGTQGFQRSSSEGREYTNTRAQSSERQAIATAENQRENAKIAFENARLAFETNVRNQQTQYDYMLKKFDIAQPKVQMTANGLLIQAPDPQNPSRMTVQFTPTRDQLQATEQIKNLAATMGMSGPFAEAVAVQTLSNMYRDNPVAGEAVMRQLAIQHTVQRGAGSAVFGKPYEEAVKTATRQLQQENVTLQSRPQDYQQVFNQRVAALLMQHPRIMEGQWIPRAAQQGVVAAYVLMPQGQPGTPAPQPGGQQQPRPGGAGAAGGGRTPQQPRQPTQPRLQSPGITIGEE